MPRTEKNSPGSFCWIELATTEQNAAKGFYSSLFGWNAMDNPMGENGFYTTFQLDGSTAAAAYTMCPEELENVPPHWNLYVAVESADASAQRVTELGGTVLAPPFDVFEIGRMAVVKDPTGAAISLWQSKRVMGSTVSHEPGSFCWADLSTPDPQRAATFYSELFGWKIAALPEKYPADYLVIANGDSHIGGIPPAAYRDPQTPPHWMIYFLITDAEAVAQKVAQLGGKILMPPQNIQNAYMSVMADPQGARFSVFAPARK